ncbi:MAG TPA: hypothetical protein VLF40_05650 [Candidatus Saccharimonadales bacterium]|nr:hypothetical protein [Candidatus Saccharimonadales bacterium]
MLTVARLRPVIEASWSAETAFEADKWSPENPARGHCVVTSLVVQHLLGGALRKLETVFDGQPESHYHNVLPDASELDLTRQQYPAGQEFAPSEVNLHGYADVREKMMHEPETRQRYELLLARVQQKLRA